MAKYALVIANNQYSDPGLAQLSAPGQDAEDFARVLRDKEIGAFYDVQILFNQAEAVVREAVDGFFAQKHSDDLLVLYFSGHGVRDEQGALYLAVSNTNRARLRSTGIKSDFIRESMDQSRSRRQVLILDCCNSGAFAHGTKGVVGDAVGTGTAFEGTGFGRVVLTATDSTQFAWEGNKIIGEAKTQNSLFTHFLVKGLEGEADQDGDGRISVDELYDYAYEQIVKLTPQQTPGKWSYKQQGEIILRQAAEGELRPGVLSADLIAALESSYPNFREAAVQQLGEILKGRNLALALAARIALEKVAASDDSRRVAQIAAQKLSSQGLSEGQPGTPTLQTVNSINESVEEPLQSRIEIKQKDTFEPMQTLQFSTPGSSLARPSWTVAFWLLLIWSIAFVGIIVGEMLIDNAINLSFGNLAGSIPASVTGGICAGLLIAWTLRLAKLLADWKSMVIIPFGFGMGLLIASYIGLSIGNSIQDTPAYVFGFMLGGAVGGAMGGLAIGLALYQEHERLGWRSILWLVLSHAAGLSLGLGLFNLLFPSVENQIGTLPGGAVSAVICGALAGAVAGTSSIYRLRKGGN